jgi:hypothetical protein
MSKKLVNNESIYSLVPPEEAKQVRPPRYTSKYPGTTAPTASTFGAASKSATGIHNAGGDYDEPPTAHPVRQATASFGPEGRTLDTHNPLAFTRCHQKEPRLPSRTFPAIHISSKECLHTRAKSFTRTRHLAYAFYMLCFTF